MKTINEFNEYQKLVIDTKIYPDDMQIIYPMIGLCGEVGEVAEKIKKTIRDKNRAFDDDTNFEIIKELGDALWYIAALAYDLGYDLSEVAHFNAEKIMYRKDTNKINGEGENR